MLCLFAEGISCFLFLLRDCSIWFNISQPIYESRIYKIPALFETKFEIESSSYGAT